MNIRRYLIHLILTAFLVCSNALSGDAADIQTIALQLRSSLNAGQAAFYNQNYPEAEQNFRTAAENAKAIGNSQAYAFAYSYLGFSQVYLDKPLEAEATLKQAEQYATTSDMPVAKMLTLLGYIEHYIRLGDIPTAQKYIQIALAQDEDTFRALAMTKEPLVRIYQSNQALEKNISELSSSAQAENYIEDALFHRKVMRWNDETKIIKIYIASGSHINGWNPEYADNFKKACLIWQNVLNNKIQFEFVENRSEPVDTVVTWQADRGIRAAETGISIHKDKQLVKADIAFHLIDNSNQFHVPSAIYKLSLHEIGHLLGIAEHSKNPDDIMFPAMTYALKPSARDVSTMLELYSRPAQITTPKGKTLSEYRKAANLQGKQPVIIFNH